MQFLGYGTVLQSSYQLCVACAQAAQNHPSNSVCVLAGDIVTLHEKKEEGWWFGSLNGKKGHFPAAYVEELPSKAGNAATQS